MIKQIALDQNNSDEFHKVVKILLKHKIKEVLYFLKCFFFNN